MQSYSPLAAFKRFCDVGPAFWADFGGGVSVIGRLRPVRTFTYEAWAEAVRAPRPPARRPWERGMVGWLGYEAGAWFERMPQASAARLLPDVWFGEIEESEVFEGSPGADEAVYCSSPAAELRWEEPPPEVFLRGVEAIRAALTAGEAYQVNLSRRMVGHGQVDPLRAWLRLRATNGARRAVLLDTGDGAVVSNSPELALRMRGGRLRSVPIKGTAPLSRDRSWLVRNAKERAELTMIVDLVRADLGRVAAAGSVRAGSRRVGRVGHVWHAMQEVQAQLAPGLDVVDAVAALLPAGSVTGAPKIRAMELIAALEPVPRGVYCGSVGWVAPRAADLNVAIRTLSIREDVVHLQVGAGVVLGSEPERELAETRLKAERMLAALA